MSAPKKRERNCFASWARSCHARWQEATGGKVERRKVSPPGGGRKRPLENLRGPKQSSRFAKLQEKPASPPKKKHPTDIGKLQEAKEQTKGPKPKGYQYPFGLRRALCMPHGFTKSFDHSTKRPLSVL